MGDSTTIAAEVREDVGKGASRRLRRQGKIPAVIYGGDRDAVALTLDHDPILHASENEAFYSSVMDIRVGDGRRQSVVVRDVHRHPFKPLIMHVDFQRISEKEVLRISVPIHFIGEEDSPAGRAAGVIIQHQVTEVEVAALPKNLPEYLEVDLSEMEDGGSVNLSDIRLPEGVEIPVLATGDDAVVANTVHVKESQGTGAAAEAEEEAGIEAAEVPVVGEEDAAADEAPADEAEDGE